RGTREKDRVAGAVPSSVDVKFGGVVGCLEERFLGGEFQVLQRIFTASQQLWHRKDAVAGGISRSAGHQFWGFLAFKETLLDSRAQKGLWALDSSSGLAVTCLDVSSYVPALELRL
uniref:Uncharacterized protein n=1 Tax=Ailuropoda melanoleuca TaxID=9646 RepID=A0A7N5KAH4_AILME